jgi:hypothetical protein
VGEVKNLDYSSRATGPGFSSGNAHPAPQRALFAPVCLC